MVDNEKIRNEAIEFLGEEMLDKMKGWLKDKKTLFPLLVEDNITISTNIYLFTPLKNHIRKNNPQIDEEMTYDKFEDYLYCMVEDIVKSL